MDTLPYGATRASDLITRMLCTEYQAINLGSYMYCQPCKHPAYGGPLVPRIAGAPVIIMDSRLQERVTGLLEALVGKVAQQRKCRGTENFAASLCARASNERGWMTAIDVDVFERLCWLDPRENRTKLVHAVTCPGVGLDSSAQCRPGNRCRKR